MTDLPSFRADMLGRYPKFIEKFLTLPCKEIRVVSNMVVTDVRTITGQNLRFVDKEISNGSLFFQQKGDKGGLECP